METVSDFIFGAPKSLQMVTAAMKLKDAYSLKESYDQPRRTFVGKVISLLLNMQATLVMIFLSRSKHLLISWLQSPSAVILEPPKIKSDTVSTVSPSTSREVMGPYAMILVF